MTLFAAGDVGEAPRTAASHAGDDCATTSARRLVKPQGTLSKRPTLPGRSSVEYPQLPELDIGVNKQTPAKLTATSISTNTLRPVGSEDTRSVLFSDADYRPDLIVDPHR